MIETQDTGVISAREVLDVLMGHGVETIVLSPGSRNTPLLIGCSARKELKKYIIPDERTAAFTALGLAMASQNPVALACTSGTALYNYAPAIAEAYYQHVPLIILTADRPMQWIDQEAQTLHQPDALTGIVKQSYNIPSQENLQSVQLSSEFENELQWYSNRVANNAMFEALNGIKGPVHINIQFSVPFNSTVPYGQKIPRLVKFMGNDNILPPHLMREISEYLLERKVLLVAGQMPSDSKLNKAIRDFADLRNVALYAEPISNLHPDERINNLFINLIDHNENLLSDLHPDVVITIGGLIVSEKMKSFIRSSNAEHWTLSDTNPMFDGYMKLTRHYDISPYRFFKGLTSYMRHQLKKGYKEKFGKYRQNWIEYGQICKRAYLENSDINVWNEENALDVVFSNLPRECNLFLSNGMTIRHAVKFLWKIPHNCWANRGVSGIDGTNATAFGTSLAYKGPTILITGDMSFSYCPDILNLHKYGGDLRIMIINNGGGDIFRNIGTTRNLECREEYFCADPSLPVRKIAESYGWEYLSIDSMDDLKERLNEFYSASKVILELKLIQP